MSAALYASMILTVPSRLCLGTYLYISLCQVLRVVIDESEPEQPQTQPHSKRDQLIPPTVLNPNGAHLQLKCRIATHFGALPEDTKIPSRSSARICLCPLTG